MADQIMKNINSEEVLSLAEHPVKLVFAHNPGLSAAKDTFDVAQIQ